MKKLASYSVVILGLIIVAVSYNLFLANYNLVAGGVSGLAIVISKLFSIPDSVFILVANIVLLVLSYICLGEEKTKNTILGSILFPIFVSIFSFLPKYIPIEIDPLLVAIIGGSLSGLGYGLVFRQNFTTGGTDILNQMAEKYLKIPMSKSIIYVDGCICLLGWVAFGFTSMIYGLIALVLISIVSNRTQLGINKNRVLYITSQKQQEIKEYIHSFGYDVTMMNALGGYSKKKQKIIMSSIHEKDYYKMKEGIKIIDPSVFIVVTNAYEQTNANMKIRNKVANEKERKEEIIL